MHLIPDKDNIIKTFDTAKLLTHYNNWRKILGLANAEWLLIEISENNDVDLISNGIEKDYEDYI